MNVFAKLQNTFTDDVFLLVALANITSAHEDENMRLRL